MRTHDLRNLELAALQAEIAQLTHEFFSLADAVHSGKEKNNARLKLVRRDIARAQTILHEKQRGGLA